MAYPLTKRESNILYMNTRKLISILIIALSVTRLGFAQDTLVLEYQRAIDIALKRSFTIQSHNMQKDAMLHYFGFYKAQFKPRLDLEMNVPVWNEGLQQIDLANELPVYNSIGSMKFGGFMSLKYILPTGGDVSLSTNLYHENLNIFFAQTGSELSRDQFFSRFWLKFDQPIFTRNRLKEDLKEAEYKLKQFNHSYTRAQMDIVYEVSYYFYQYYRAVKELEITQEQLKNSKESYRIAVLKSETGRIPKADVLSAEVAVEKDKAELLRVQNYLENKEGQLKQLIGLELNKPIKIMTNLEFQPFLIEEQKAIAEALEHRHEIKETEYEIHLKDINIDRAKREREFKGNISFYYDLTGMSTENTSNLGDLVSSSFNDMQVRPHNRGLALTLSYPIIDWGRGKEKVKEANLRKKERELYLEDLKITIERQVHEIIRTVRESREQIAIHKKNLELARKSYDISKMRFENGDISNQELSIEQSQMVNIQLAYLDAFITYQLAVNDLKRKTMWDFQNKKSYIIDND